MYDFKHLTLEQRMDIQIGLKEDLTLKDLSERIHKSPRTISQEIRLHLIRRESSKSEFNGTPKFACSRHLRYPYVCDACPFKLQCASDRRQGLSHVAFHNQEGHPLKRDRARPYRRHPEGGDRPRPVPSTHRGEPPGDPRF